MSPVRRANKSLRGIFKKRGEAKRGSKLAMNQVLTVKETKRIPNSAQLKHLPLLLNENEKRIASFAIILILVAGSVLAIQLFNTQRSEVPAVGGQYTEGLIGTPQLINPLYAIASDVDTDLSRLIYNGLMRYDAELGLIPDLAESYTISEDQKTYTFILRNDVEWHDGKPFRAADVIFTTTAIQSPEYSSPLAVSFAGVKVEQGESENTIIFTLEEPFAPFLSLLTVGIIPSHLWSEIPGANTYLSELNRRPIGTGPYKFEKLIKDSKGTIRSYTLKRNANFHRGAPSIERLSFKFYTDSASAAEALRNNNIEGVSFLSTDRIAAFEKDNNLQLVSPALQQYTAAFFNLRRTTISDVKVREALAYATNKSTIVETALNGHGKTVESFILPGMIGEDPNQTIRSFDQNQAASLLEEAGWTLNENGTIREKAGSPLILQLVTLNNTELLATAELLKSQWLAVGVDLQITTVDNATFQSDTLRNRAYDVLLSGELYGIDPDPYAFWHSSQTDYPGLNLSGFSNRNADEKIESGRTTMNREERATAYSELQTIVNETVPAVFLYQPTYTFVVPRKIKGIEAGQIVTPADRWSSIEEWYIKTKRILKKHAPKLEETEIES